MTKWIIAAMTKAPIYAAMRSNRIRNWDIGSIYCNNPVEISMNWLKNKPIAPISSDSASVAGSV